MKKQDIIIHFSINAAATATILVKHIVMNTVSPLKGSKSGYFFLHIVMNTVNPLTGSKSG